MIGSIYLTQLYVHAPCIDIPFDYEGSQETHIDWIGNQVCCSQNMEDADNKHNQECKVSSRRVACYIQVQKETCFGALELAICL